MRASDSKKPKNEIARMAATIMQPAGEPPQPRGHEPPIQFDMAAFYKRLIPVIGVAVLGLFVLTYDRWTVLLVLLQAVLFALSIYLWLPESIQHRN